MFIIAQILGILGSASNIISMQLKKKQHILICFILAGVLFTGSYLLLNGYSGAIVCLIATLQTGLSYIYDRKNKELPKWLIIIFFILSTLGGVLTYQNILDIFAILAGVTYTWSIIQKQEKYIRLITLSNSALWFIYDIFIKAYSTCISDAIIILSTLIGIIRFDVLKNKNER